MTEERIIPALAPRKRRQGAAAALDSANRAPAVQTPAKTPAEATLPEPTQVKPKKQPKAASASTHRRAQGKVQIAVDVPEALRGRARTAFKYANFHDGAASFSEFVAEAIEEKVRSVEREHNNGNEFDPDESNLRSGRPTGG